MNIFRTTFKKAANYYHRRKLFNRFKTTLALNKTLKNSKTGKRCFILGSGPSIKNLDLTKLKNEETIVATSFWNHPQYQEINPKYHFLVDADMFPPPGRIQEKGLFFRDTLEEKTQLLESCSTKFFVNINGKVMLERSGVLSKNDKFYLAFDGFFKENLKFNADIDKIIPNGKNTIVTAIMVAIYMGFEKIYLLGCEHDFLAYPKHYEGFKHFFDEPKYDLSNPNEVKKYALDTCSYERLIYDVGVLFRNYRLLKEKFAKEKPNVKIYNATPASFLDVFPSVKFEEINL